MKINSALVIMVVLLLVWNCFLTVQHFDGTEEHITNENVTNVSVSGFSTDLSEVYEKVNSNCVGVVSFSSTSSGIIFQRENDAFYVLTANHGVSGENNVTVVLDNDIRYTGEVIGSDIFTDLAVIKVTSNIEVPVTVTGDSDLIKEGEFVLSVGTPGTTELHNSATFAMVSGKLRTISNYITTEEEKYSYYLSVIQLSGDVESGYSGSGIFNMNGECIGIITMKSTSEIIAIPINEAKIVAEHLIAGQPAGKVMLGIKGSFIADLETYEKSALNINLETVNGLYVSNVQNDSLAQLFGLKQGDVILSINGQSIVDNTDYLNICYTECEEYTFVVERDNETLELKGYPND